MGGLQVNKFWDWKKVWKIGGGDDKKNSLLTFNSNIYNENDDAHICSNLAQSLTTKISQEVK